MKYIKIAIRLFITTFFLLLFASISFALKPPTPTLSEGGDIQKTKTEKQKEKPKSTKHIPKFAPTEPVSISPPLLAQETAKNDGKNRKYQPSPDWWIVLFTGILAWYTSRLYKATVALSKDAQKTAKRQNSLERPWLFMEKIRVERREGAPIKPEMANNWWVSFNWRNIGRSPALIESCVFHIEDTNNFPKIPDYVTASKLTCPSTVAAGIAFETSKVGPAVERQAIGKEAICLTVYGRLTYKELNGQRHHTGFAVDVSPHLPASSTSKHKDYEYYD